MNIKIVILIFFVLVFPGCFTMHVDSMARFSVKGEVYDVNNRPLEKVKVIFVDTGLDSVRSKIESEKEIGVSDNQGKIDLTFDYWWGMEKGLLMKKPPMTFDIELSIEHYKNKRFHFRMADLSNEGDKLLVPLNRVYLQPNQ